MMNWVRRSSEQQQVEVAEGADDENNRHGRALLPLRGENELWF